MKYAIIENEEFARINLRNMIEAVRPEYLCVFTAETVEECVEYFSSRPDVQLIFMDIELDDANCFELFRNVKIEIPVIFTTAYDEFAVKAFKVNSVDYLLKPITEKDVLDAIEKFEKRISVQGLEQISVANEMARAKIRSRILVSSGDSYSFIHTDDIAWIMAEDKYVSIVTTDGRVRLSDFGSLGELTDVLDPLEFFQISRGVIASISSIVKISKFLKGRLRVELRAGESSRSEIVSAARRPEFLDWVGHTGKA